MIKSKKSPTLLLQNKVDFELCERFRQIRKERGLTQPDFAAELGTTRVAVNAIENKRYNPGIDLLKIIRHKYKISYDFLIDGK